MKILMVAKAFVVAAVAAVMAGDIEAARSLSYVQDGLVAQWDGIENVGRGRHDGTATAWTDLTGNGHDLKNFISGLSWQGDSLVMPTASYGMAATFAGSVAVGLNDYCAYEIVFLRDAVQKKFVFGFGSFKGLAICDNYLAVNNGTTSCFTASPSAKEVHQLYVDYDSKGNGEQVVLDGEVCPSVAGSEGWTQKTSGIGYANNSNWAFHGQIYAIRIYNRKLSASEREWNRQIDAQRFLKKSANSLYVTSDTIACGEPTPNYGIHESGESGDDCSAPTAWTSEDGTTRATLKGYAIYSRDAATNARTFVREGTEASVTVERDETSMEVEWKWDVEVRPSVTAEAGGTVTGVTEWMKLGDTFTVEATPSEGYVFGWWSGDLPSGCDNTQPVLTMKTTTAAQHLVAHFRKLVYVAKDGDDANGGTSWDDALASLSVALAKDENPCVMVGPGLYETNGYITIDKPAVVVGKKTEKGTETVFRLTAAKGAIFVLSHAFARVENLALTTADKAYGRGVLVRSAGTVDSCVITNCYCDASKTYFGNDVPNDGGGVFLWYGGTVRNTYFYKCSPLSQSGDYRGGGIAIFGAGLAENCEIRDCWASKQGGGGVYLKDGGTLRNSLVAGCYMTDAQDSTGISMTGGQVENCTITGNHMEKSSTASAVTISGGTIVNSVIWGNVNGSGVAGVKQTGGTISYCTHETLLAGEGNITVNPVFADPNADDYTLTLTDCVDAGTELPWHEDAKDLKGDSRVMGKAVDLGCYEFKSDGLVASISYESDGRNDSAEVTFTATVMGAQQAKQTYAWHVTSAQGYDVARSGEDLATLTLALPTGEYTVSLTVTDGAVSADALPVGGILVKASHTYVKKGSVGVEPYTLPENATEDIQAAFKFAGPGGIVHVDDGFYTMDDTLRLDEGARVKSDNGPGAVTLFTKPKTTGFPIVLFAHGGAVLDGVTLSGYSEDRKQANICCAVRLGAEGGTVTNCVIDGLAYDTAPGGVGVQMTEGLVVDTIIRNCTSPCQNVSRDGIGVSMSGGTIDRCVISNNVTVRHASSRGGGVFMTGGTLSNSIIANNECSGSGGGVYNTLGKVVNCLVYGNKGWGSGTGVYQNGTGSLINLTVAGNVTNTTEVAAACHVTGKATVKNCLVWGNEGVTDQLSPAPSGATFANNCSTEDPAFRNPALGDYRLTVASTACIDMGDDSAWTDLATAVDILGKPRLRRGHIDIGCYERQFSTLILSVR